MTGAWVCLSCPDHGSGTAAEADRASQRHSRTVGHATATALGGATGPLRALQPSSGSLAGDAADRATATKEKP